MMFEKLRRDLKVAYEQAEGSPLRRMLCIATDQGVMTIAVYRLGHWLHNNRSPLTLLLKPGYFVASKLSEVGTGNKIWLESEIGGGLNIHNFGGVMVNGTLGENCTLVQGAQIASRGDGRKAGYPRLGNRVYVGAGAKVLGPVVIGDDARIGANAVVLQDVPPGATAVGVPARIVLKSGGGKERAANPTAARG